MGIAPLKGHAPASIAGSSPLAGASYNGLTYNGGPVMNNPNGVNVYLIWYGDWSSNREEQQLVTDFVAHVGGTVFWNILSSYYAYNAEGEKVPITNRLHLGGSITDNYSLGKVLTDDDVGSIIQDAATTGKLPFDLNGIYYLLSSADVSETSGFCSSYCAFHGYRPTPQGTLIGAFAGDENACPAACAWSAVGVTPPNGENGDVDAVSHELAESITDPLGTGWVNYPLGIEVADLCEGILGKVKPLPGGVIYNLKLGGQPFVTSELWVNARGGYCALAFDE